MGRVTASMPEGGVPRILVVVWKMPESRATDIETLNPRTTGSNEDRRRYRHRSCGRHHPDLAAARHRRRPRLPGAIALCLRRACGKAGARTGRAAPPPARTIRSSIFWGPWQPWQSAIECKVVASPAAGPLFRCPKGDTDFPPGRNQPSIGPPPLTPGSGTTKTVKEKAPHAEDHRWRP